MNRTKSGTVWVKKGIKASDMSLLLKNFCPAMQKRWIGAGSARVMQVIKEAEGTASQQDCDQCEKDSCVRSAFQMMRARAGTIP